MDLELADAWGLGPMPELKHRIIQTNGIQMHLAEQGVGPLILLCHGFPELWYSWRHQLAALADAGFRAVAPDMRGYGQTDQPPAADQYTLLHSIGDMVGLLDALGAAQSVVIGHDWGAPLAWAAALLRPDRFRAVIALSGPFGPRSPSRPTTVMPQTAERLFYQLYFQAPGVAEAEFERDVRLTIRTLLYSISGDAPGRVHSIMDPNAVGMVDRASGFLAQMLSPENLPHWLSETDVDFYAGEFARTGFRGGLNRYRAIDRNWELFAPFAGAKVSVPALFIGGERDIVLDFPGVRQRVKNMRQVVPQLKGATILPGCGHWTQQERPDEVNSRIIQFLRQLDEK
jgi:pimeloyl-ACP methyl ester carboxylesterase